MALHKASLSKARASVLASFLESAKDARKEYLEEGAKADSEDKENIDLDLDDAMQI